MSKGGGSQTTTSEPWSGAQPYLKDIMGQASSLYRTGGPQYYPGQSFQGPTPGQISGWNTNLNYADQVFGGQNTPKFGQASDALSSALTGRTALGNFAGDLGPMAASQINAGFGSGMPNLSTASGFDTTGAFKSALSGTPNYGAVKGAVDAANQQVLDQFNQQILPGLNSRASFLGNPTGGIKTLNSVLPRLGQLMDQNAQSAYLNEYDRALGAQQNASQFLTQAGLNSQNDYRNQLLGFGSLEGNLAQGAGSQALQGAGLFPTLASAGQYPGQLSQSFANWGAGFGQQALGDQVNRFNYYQNAPYQNLANYQSIIGGYGGLGGSSTQKQSGNSGLGALGGLLVGGNLFGEDGPLEDVIPGISGGVGAGIGALLGVLSDRRAKADITRVGALDSGLPVYRYRYKGSSEFHLGVMADEARDKFPHAVLRGPDGLDRVNYEAVS